MKIKTKIVSSHTADSKPVKQEVNGTVILPPLVFPDIVIHTYTLSLFHTHTHTLAHAHTHTYIYTHILTLSLSHAYIYIVTIFAVRFMPASNGRINSRWCG